MFPYKQLRGAHNYCLNCGLNRWHRLHGLLPQCSIGSNNVDTVSDHSASRKNTETGDVRNGTGKSSLVHLAPAGRNVYSTWDNKIPQAPAGRHVCRIGWMHDKLVVEYWRLDVEIWISIYHWLNLSGLRPPIRVGKWARRPRPYDWALIDAWRTDLT